MGKGKKSMRKFAKQGGVKKAIAKRRSAQGKRQVTANRKQERRVKQQKTKTEGEAALGRTLEKRATRKRTEKKDEEDDDGGDMDGFAGMSMDDFMSGKFLEESGDESEEDSSISAVSGSMRGDQRKHKQASTRNKNGNGNEDSSNSDSDSEEAASDDDATSSAIHQAQLEQLKKTDPEFAKYLAENDPAALDFGGGDLDDVDGQNNSGSENDSENEDDNAEDMPPDQSNARSRNTRAHNSEILTSAKLRVLIESALDKQTANGTREIVRAFAAATHMTDTDNSAAVNYKYSITSSTVYNDLMFATVSRLHETLAKLLPVKGPSGSNPVTARQLPSAHSRWSTLRDAVKSFLKNFLHLMTQVTDTAMLVMLFKNLEHYVSYAACFPALPKKFLRELLKVWSTTSKKDLRLVSFMCIRRLALNTPFPFIEQCMKGLYLSFVRNSKVMNEQSRGAVAMMAKCIVELVGSDMVAAYQHAFVYIRQLAIHLRNAIKNKSKDSYAAVFNWQYMNCLMVWSAVVSTYPAENQLRALVYPLVQIIVGTVNLVSSAKYFPMRFHCVDLLNKLSAATGGTLIPVPALLLDALRCPEFGKIAASTRRPPRLEFSVKVSSKDIQTKGYQDLCVMRALELLEHHFQIHKWSIAFPELAHSTAAALKKFSRDSQVARWRQQCKAVVARIERQVQTVEAKRNAVPFGPKDLDKAKAFMAGEASSAHRVYLEQQAKHEEESILKSENSMQTGVSGDAAKVKKKKKKIKTKNKSQKESGKKRRIAEEEDKERFDRTRGKRSRTGEGGPNENGLEDEDAVIQGGEDAEDDVQDIMLSEESDSD